MHTSHQNHGNEYKCRSHQRKICGFCCDIRKHVVLYHDLFLKKVSPDSVSVVFRPCVYPVAPSLKHGLILILPSDLRATRLTDEALHVCATMNDATLKQIAAVKPTVNNGSAIWT